MKQRVLTPKLIIWGMILLVFFLATAFFDAWCGIQSRRLGYEIEQAGNQQEKLLDFQKKLKIEKARLTSPQALRQYATSKLELATPKSEQIVVIHETERK